MVDWWLAMFNTLAALGLGYFWHHHLVKVHSESALKKADDIVRDARKEAAIIVREGEAQAKEELIRKKDAQEEQSRKRYEELVRLTDQFSKREATLFEKVALLDEREHSFEERREKLVAERAEVADQLEKLQRKLAEVSGLSKDQARSLVLDEAKSDTEAECDALARKLLEEARTSADDKARKVVALAIERMAAPVVNEVSATTVKLPSEEMKGRLIGKEGRNIKSFEHETGVNLIVDDTPETATISGYDPLRREVARKSLEALVLDGRIHPGTIEETVARMQQEVDETVRIAGKDAIQGLGLREVADEIVYMTGRLKFRHSYMQNILDHSIEMAHIMASMAGELMLDVQVAKRIGLFHDIGKALTHEVEGSHALIGGDLLEKYGESEVVVNAVSAHHGEIEPSSVYAHLTTAADAITAARPGARMENTQIYLERLGDMEAIANAYEGVNSSYAIHAGRELRVVVNSEVVDDTAAMKLAKDISGAIEEQMEFPGQIKVVVMRETRCVEYAR